MHTLFKVLPMCGIIGYSGSENAVPILISALYSLEYRGYDSSGITLVKDNELVTVKSEGRIDKMEERLKESFPELFSNCGIGHTRWATHGAPSTVNSHPHSTENVSLVHNGIIENYISLKNNLIKRGVRFLSETDTEVALKLIDIKYRETGDPISAIRMATTELCGSYAFGIIFKDFPDRIYAVKKDSPLIAAKSDNGGFIASDITAVLKYTNNISTLCDGEIAVICGNDIVVYNNEGSIIEKKFERINWSFELAEKNGFPHFMLKEIHEEPEAILKTFAGRIYDGIPSFDISEKIGDRIQKCRRIHIVACGTAMHAGLIGKYFLEKYLRIPVNVEIASEFRYKNPIIENDDIFIALSQSGETADTLASLRLAKERGLYTLSIVNVPGSTIARESDDVIYTYAGPEIAVASTKAYTVQICILYMLSMQFALRVGKMSFSDIIEGTKILTENASCAIKKALVLSNEIRDMCKMLSEKNSIFFIGRGLDSYLASEASLKLKEIAYINSEAYSAGELKHGTISLVTNDTAVVAVLTEKELFSKTLSNIKEVKARGASVIAICDEYMEIPIDECDSVIRIPHLDNGLTCLTAATAFQLLAYHTASILGNDIDKPRNLAKSVTVE